MTNAGQNSNYISGKTGDWEIVIGPKYMLKY